MEIYPMMQKQNGKRAFWRDFLVAIKPSQSCAIAALWVSKMKSQQIWQWNEKGTQISNSDALLLSSRWRVWESSVDTWTSPLPARYVAFSWEPIIPKAMDLLQLTNHVVQKSPYWRANDALGHVEQRKFKFGGFLYMSQCVILYQVIAQLQKAHSTEPALRAGKVS